uniref:Mediator of RNA polymerase II transcription subunit 23 n=1 Tax=Caenorhabditis japonica TaxID=281687 RepID=A0A8R1IMY8_CAEJA
MPGEKASEGGDDKIEMDASFSPQFVWEVNRVKSDIQRLVDNNFTREFFRPLSSNMADNTAILRVQFNNLMSKMEEKEKQSLVKELIKMVHHVAPDKTFVGTNYESVVDQLLQYAHERGVISTTLCAEGLIMTTDFRLCSRIDQKKWKFIQECIQTIDYKGIRNILRYILESQLRRLPYSLAPEQMKELRIVEDVVLHIIDRESNLMPPLITLSEIMRGMPKQAHMFPRLTERLANLSVYFRPIADLAHVNGRSFIYPIPMHPSFFPQTCFWEDPAHQNAFVQSHHTLPYRLEHTHPYLYTLYMILRQPWGKDSFNVKGGKTKSHWDVLISVMICEAMAAAESLPEHERIPRYQWDNIVNIAVYGVLQHLLIPKNFFKVLKGLIRTCRYTRARDEVMWVVFQIVGSHGNHVRIDDSVQEIVDLYHDLFDGDVTWTGASDHPALFARFLAAACTWMSLERDVPDKLPEPNNTIKNHIKFIHDGCENFNFDSSNTAMLAVLINAGRFLMFTTTKIEKNRFP